MANPRFRNLFDATDEYVWDTLNAEPEPAVIEAKLRRYFRHERIGRDGQTVGFISTHPTKAFGRSWPLTFDVDRTQLDNLRRFWGYGAFILFPEDGDSTNYTVEWVDESFEATKQPGGRFRLTALLIQVG